ncbi:MAG: hypothetical protein HC915_01075 [Anaerolineae bacterium]|nr:hypothetical protein [Anaerolineae bacterium]
MPVLLSSGNLLPCPTGHISNLGMGVLLIHDPDGMYSAGFFHDSKHLKGVNPLLGVAVIELGKQLL